MIWISVKDRIPEEDVQILTYLAHAVYPKYNLDYIVLFPEYSPPYIWACTLHDDMDKVTHWMPLPRDPNTTEPYLTVPDHTLPHRTLPYLTVPNRT